MDEETQQTAEPFVPQHLNAEQIEQLYDQALQQAEVTLANAWVNHRLSPHDESQLALYLQQARLIGELVADRDRILTALRPAA